MFTGEDLLGPIQFCMDKYIFYAEVLEGTYYYNSYYAAKAKK